MEEAAAQAGEVDRLSDLPDDVLGDILSFLPTREAGRTAVLSSRWRNIIASVHTFSFEQPASPFSDCESCYYGMVDEKRSRNSYFLNDVTSAFLRRRRCAGSQDPPLRALRISFEWYHPFDAVMVDRWLACAMQNGAKDLHHVELRLEECCEEICDYAADTKREDRMYKQVTDSSEEDDDDLDLPNFVESDDSDNNEEDEYYHRYQRRLDYTVPKRIFYCVALRKLCLGACLLNPPATTFCLPSLETLLLAGLTDSGEEIHRLISSCPRLVDLTLAACNQVREISVLHKCLRRLALRCCHKLLSVAVDASDLQTFQYKGAVPSPSFLTLLGSAQRISSSCTIDFCGKELSIKGQFVWFKKLVKKFIDTKHLHLQSACLGSGFEDPVFNQFPVFCFLRHLELGGRLQYYYAVDAVIRILKQAPNLEVLSLFIKPHPDNGSYDQLADPREVDDTAISCLRDHVRQIKIVGYQGHEAQRMLLKFLLRNALVLDEVRCVFPKQPLHRKTEMTTEITGWVMNESAKITFE